MMSAAVSKAINILCAFFILELHSYYGDYAMCRKCNDKLITNTVHTIRLHYLRAHAFARRMAGNFNAPLREIIEREILGWPGDWHSVTLGLGFTS